MVFMAILKNQGLLSRHSSEILDAAESVYIAAVLKIVRVPLVPIALIAPFASGTSFARSRIRHDRRVSASWPGEWRPDLEVAPCLSIANDSSDISKTIPKIFWPCWKWATAHNFLGNSSLPMEHIVFAELARSRFNSVGTSLPPHAARVRFFSSSVSNHFETCRMKFPPLASSSPAPHHPTDAISGRFLGSP